jgi:hypothetical protein
MCAGSDSKGQEAERGHHDLVVRDAESPPQGDHLLPLHRDAGDRLGQDDDLRVRNLVADRPGHEVVVDRHEARGLYGNAEQGIGVGQQVSHRAKKRLEEAVAHLRVGVGELGAPGLEPGSGRIARGDAGRVPSPGAHRLRFQELGRPRVVEDEVVQAEQPRNPREVVVEEGVARPVPHLVDDDVVRVLEVARLEPGDGPYVAPSGEARAVDRGLGVEDFDLVVVVQEREHVRRVVGDPRRGGRQGRQERDAQGADQRRASSAYSSGP